MRIEHEAKVRTKDGHDRAGSLKRVRTTRGMRGGKKVLSRQKR